MLKITRLAISQKPVNPKNKKKVGRENIFLHLYTGFGVKIQNTHRYRNSATFLTSWQLALNGPEKQPNGDILKNPKKVKESTLGYTYG